MAIPDYQQLMLPLLRYAGDGQEHTFREATEQLADALSLNDNERTARLPSGKQAVFSNRVGWASTYLKKAQLLSSTARGRFKITDRGAQVLAEKPAAIDNKYLERFAEFQEFRSMEQAGEESTSSPETHPAETKTPEELIESAVLQLRTAVEEELLNQAKGGSSAFFEQLVIDLLLKMGYGGSRHDAGEAIGRSHDGGIDGIIKEDRLGLELIYVQAKKWNGSVGRPELQKFAGALLGRRAKKGVFITTSTFSRDAEEYVEHLDSKIVLIDGRRLAQLMFEHDVGVTTAARYQVKKIDSDYFDDGTQTEETGTAGELVAVPS